jgi:lysophospholipase L1-like esterase
MHALFVHRLLAVSLAIVLFAATARAQSGAAPATKSATAPSTRSAIPTLWIIGDSTVRNGQDNGNNGQWGWGNPIASFFDKTRIRVMNKAVGGTSSRTFQTNANMWPAVLKQMQPGDYVIMQFGHNDGGDPADPARARASLPGNGEDVMQIHNPLTKQDEVVHSYGWYLRKYVTDAQGKGAAMVIICSLIPRNHWTNGTINPTADFTLWAKQAAETAKVPFIDLNGMVGKKYNALGEKVVTDTLFPAGETTHTDWAGAVLNAQTVIEGIRTIDHCPIADALLPNPPTDLKNPTGKAR